MNHICQTCGSASFTHEKSWVEGNSVKSHYRCDGCRGLLELERIFKDEKSAEVGKQAILQREMVM